MKISQLNFLALSTLCVLALGLEEVDPKVDSGKKKSIITILQK